MALTKIIMMMELLLMIMFSELHSEREQRGQLGSQFEVQSRSSAFPDTQVAPRVPDADDDQNHDQERQRSPLGRLEPSLLLPPLPPRTLLHNMVSSSS